MFYFLRSHHKLSMFQLYPLNLKDIYGFRRGKSTIDAMLDVKRTAKQWMRGPRRTRKMCAFVLLDVRNAFNSARWDCILNALRDFEVPGYLINIVGSYLKD